MGARGGRRPPRRRVGGRGAPPGRAPPGPSVTFASWVGGDRDGHPLVTPEVTLASLADYRQAALDLHRASLRRLVARAFEGVYGGARCSAR